VASSDLSQPDPQYGDFSLVWIGFQIPKTIGHNHVGPAASARAKLKRAASKTDPRVDGQLKWTRAEAPDRRRPADYFHPTRV